MRKREIKLYRDKGREDLTESNRGIKCVNTVNKRQTGSK